MPDIWRTIRGQVLTGADKFGSQGVFLIYRTVGGQLVVGCEEVRISLVLGYRSFVWFGEQNLGGQLEEKFELGVSFT